MLFIVMMGSDSLRGDRLDSGSAVMYTFSLGKTITTNSDVFLEGHFLPTEKRFRLRSVYRVFSVGACPSEAVQFI